MKHTYKYWINKDGKPMTGKYYHFKSFKVYWAYRKWIAEDIAYKDFNTSFTGQFLNKGFIPYKTVLNLKQPSIHTLEDKDFKPSLNWFGVSTYTPDITLVKDNKSIVLSLQGINTPYNEKYKELFDSVSVRYICIKECETVLYEDWTGNIPNKEIVNKFLN